VNVYGKFSSVGAGTVWGGGGRPGSARTILLFYIISARPSKQPRMVGSTLGVYSFGLMVVSARTNKRHHHLALRSKTQIRIEVLGMR
jgi:hypothetical protein